MGAPLRASDEIFPLAGRAGKAGLAGALTMVVGAGDVAAGDCSGAVAAAGALAGAGAGSIGALGGAFAGPSSATTNRLPLACSVTVVASIRATCQPFTRSPTVALVVADVFLFRS